MLSLFLGSTPTMSADLDKWADPLLWAPVTTIEGKEVSLKMYKLSDTVTKIESAKSLKPSEGCSASYYYIQDGKEVSHGPSYTWKPGGGIIQKAYSFQGQLRYFYRYYPTGELLQSEIYDQSLNSTITTWYEKEGSVVGKRISVNKPLCETTDSDNKYYWNGKSVTQEEYYEMTKAFTTPGSK
jgi:hypothetical protein